MQNLDIRQLIDCGRLQHLQDEFCKVAGVYAYCLDDRKEPLTRLSGCGPTEEIPERMQKLQKAQHVYTALERVEEGSLEELAVENFPGNEGRVAALAIRFAGETCIYWVVFDLSDGSDSDFMMALDLLRDANVAYFTGKLSAGAGRVGAVNGAANKADQSDGDVWVDGDENLWATEATTEIVQLLGWDEQIELVMDRWLLIITKQLRIDAAEIFQLNSDGETMDLLCQWRAPGVISTFDKTRGMKVCTALDTEKPLVLSSDKMPEELVLYDLSAVMIFPVVRGENGTSMVVSLNHRGNTHSWRTEEVKFAADSVKILQTIITGRIQKNSLAGSYAALESILDNVGCAIYVTDKRTGNMLFANRRLQSAFSKELADGSFLELIEQGMSQGKEGGAFELFFEAQEHWYEMLFKELPWVDGRAVVLYSFYDITDRKKYQHKMEQQAYTDFLTGLYNRMCCERDLAKQIDEAKATGGTGALIYMDLDDFKHINDGLGHQYGDVLLKSISNSLQSVHGIENSCYRMGGDEFVIVIPPTSYEWFEDILTDIKEIFAKPWFLKNADYYCTTSMGIVTFPDSGDSVSELIKKADIAMYDAKRSGKNRMAKYNNSLDSESGKRLDMEKHMRNAAAAGCREFEVYYQPVISTQRAEPYCKGAEALIRWNSATQGMVSPAEFIPLAEYLGLINPIGNYVLAEACRQCKEWNDMGYPDFSVNVNLSVVQLLQTNIIELIQDSLEKSGIAPENLTLEVTESLAINDMERMKSILGRIKELGVQIALDDFGTGYSSLNHIREIPFDIIKVDQSFVKDLAEDAYSQAFIKLVSELAETIGVSVCVEGIENWDQYRVLQDMRVKYIQGYFFDRPMTKNEFEKKYILTREEEK